MRIALYIVCALIGLCLLYVLTAFLYACVKLKKRPIRKLYDSVRGGGRFTPLGCMPDHLLKTVIRLEDLSFYSHKGYSLYTIRRSMKENLRRFRIVGGGSTITQQLAKNLYFRFNRTYFRKLAELVITLRLEKLLTKDEILELYLNVIYYGNGTWGIGAASEFYFGVDPSELTLNESVFLITLLPAPTAKNPLIHPDRYIAARDENIRLLSKSAVITSREAEDLKSRYTEAYPDDRLQPREKKQLPVPMRNDYINPKRSK
ncbi:MAG: transglycosylase domain-containing protein [Clostridia bacterium]|nr:transglycosylase domain-containing protein [Clostridia bacterium]